MLKCRLALFALVSLTLVGCGNPSSRLIGKWKFDAGKAIAQAAGENKDGPGAAAMAGMAQMMGAKMEMIVEFKADGAASISATGIPFAPAAATEIKWKAARFPGR